MTPRFYISFINNVNVSHKDFYLERISRDDITYELRIFYLSYCFSNLLFYICTFISDTLYYGVFTLVFHISPFVTLRYIICQLC